ncbi:MAG TPA: hypothetical protein P5205_18115 [Candidatus Paceibacterota bacterium]|nr:hypothetical protein [Verrucomicrobiota bacterium]HSA12279.1 hypothetical protein [Candidatus Paceibacterota bacterium]
MDFKQYLESLADFSPEQKKRIFEAIRKDITIHPYEKEIGAPAEVILEAISRSPDLTQRGVRGIVAEAIFCLEVLPTVSGWSGKPVANDSFDALLEKNEKLVRIQVKTQRRKDGVPMLANRKFPGHFVVEVQRTRGGTDDQGAATRPYRFGEFDLLAVCMWASTGNWRNFMFAPAQSLIPDPRDKNIILKMQPIPKSPAGIWTDNLQVCLDTYFGRGAKPIPVGGAADLLL